MASYQEQLRALLKRFDPEITAQDLQYKKHTCDIADHFKKAPIDVARDATALRYRENKGE